jgi:hypothetical protein
MRKTVRSIELGYLFLEKQAYELVQSLKHVRIYIGNSKVIAFLPHHVVKYILIQHDCLERRGKWIFKIQEYDLEFKPMKLVEGK